MTDKLVTMDTIKYIQMQLNSRITVGTVRIDAPTLYVALEEFKAAQKRVGVLETALEALVEIEALGLPGGYINFFPEDDTFHCTYCYSHWLPGETERHDDGCPVLVAKQLLK